MDFHRDMIKTLKNKTIYCFILLPLIIQNIAFYTFSAFFFFGTERKSVISVCSALKLFFIFTFKNPMEGRIGKAQKIFRVVKIFSMILKWWIHVIIHLSKSIKCTTPRGKTLV